MSINRKHGYTLVEVMATMMIMGLVTSGALAVMVSSTASFQKTSAQTFSDIDAVQAMQRIVMDVREAKSIQVVNSNKIVITLPKRTADNYYDRRELDSLHPITYYLSNNTGSQTKTGTWLWRSSGGNGATLECIKKNVAGVSYVQDTLRSIKITVITENRLPKSTKRTELTQRVVYLRNY